MTAISLQAETRLPTEHGVFDMQVYRTSAGELLTTIVAGKPHGCPDLPLRVHSACFTSETLGSLKCDCKQQLDYALSYITDAGGVVLYLQQEGRGIGLENKIRAYALQQEGYDTIEANLRLGLPVDARTYEHAAAVIRHLGIASIRLITNNPDKIRQLEALGVVISGVIPVPAVANTHSIAYLETKRRRMGHSLRVRDAG